MNWVVPGTGYMSWMVTGTGYMKWMVTVTRYMNWMVPGTGYMNWIVPCTRYMNWYGSRFNQFDTTIEYTVKFLLRIYELDCSISVILRLQISRLY